jgi:RsiW-degrading membrane proteinase PrsW (M82 family)
MPIDFICNCGRKLHAPNNAAGRRGRCPACQEIFTVPSPAISIEEPVDIAATPDPFAIDDAGGISLAPAATPANPSRSIYVPRIAIGKTEARVAHESQKREAALVTPESQSRGYLYFLLLLLLIPLAWSTLHRDHNEFRDHLTLTFKNHPELRLKLAEVMSSETATKDQLFEALPSHKLDGALLSYDTWGHWALAGISGIVFLVAVLAIFPLGHAKIKHLILIAVFTGTAGIVLLLGLQWLAYHVPLFTPRGLISILIDIVWLIGLSYRMATQDYGFFLSFLGFTAGVGFCEEACKALPLIFKARSTGFGTWRSAMLWGLLSGVGFGVSEGITYSSDSYNGIYGGQIYLVRFISCVGLHAIWAAAVGITIFRRQDHFRGQMHPLEWLWRTLQAVIVPMVLHGAYDTLLKQQHDLYALGIALISFGWLAWQIEMAKRHFDEDFSEHPELAAA